MNVKVVSLGSTRLSLQLQAGCGIPEGIFETRTLPCNQREVIITQEELQHRGLRLGFHGNDRECLQRVMGL